MNQLLQQLSTGWMRFSDWSKAFLGISQSDRPRRMYRRGRPVVPVFRPTEKLYCRFRKQDIVGGVLLPPALKFPKGKDNTGHSVNRSRFSTARDALWGKTTRHEGLGVFQFPVSCLPAVLICRDTKRQFTFFPRHVPLENNYAHSEIWCDHHPPQGGQYVLPTALVKKELKAAISRSHTVVIPAQR
jgi:hypothetical protein